MKIITPSVLLVAFATLGTATAAPAETAREVRVEVSDPGDPAGGADVTTSLIGDRACTESVLDDGSGARRELEICVNGGAVHLRLKRHAAGKVVDVRFAARPEAGKRVRLGKIALGPKQVLEAFVTVD